MTKTLRIAGGFALWPAKRVLFSSFFACFAVNSLFPPAPTGLAPPRHLHAPPQPSPFSEKMGRVLITIKVISSPGGVLLNAECHTLPVRVVPAMIALNDEWVGFRFGDHKEFVLSLLLISLFSVAIFFYPSLTALAKVAKSSPVGSWKTRRSNDPAAASRWLNISPWMPS